jgi:hypothetical protein
MNISTEAEFENAKIRVEFLDKNAKLLLEEATSKMDIRDRLLSELDQVKTDMRFYEVSPCRVKRLKDSCTATSES